MDRLADYRETNVDITKGHNRHWDITVPTLLKDEENYYYKEISGVTAAKYIYDFNGLLKSLGVRPEYYYPNILANGLRSSREYDGINKKIKIMKENILMHYVDKTI